jgi:hypothetical protein
MFPHKDYIKWVEKILLIQLKAATFGGEERKPPFSIICFSFVAPRGIYSYII